MLSDRNFVKTIFNTLDFTTDEIKTIAAKFEMITAKKSTILIKPSDIVNDMYFITEGCLRTYYIDKTGKEHTVQFGIKDWWITDFTAFFSEDKAIMYLEVLKDATIYKLNKDDKEDLHHQFPEIHTFIRKKLESAFAAFQKRILSNLSETATERYISFITSHPEIERNVKNYHIASYLGITTESLSRIRKELS